MKTSTLATAIYVCTAANTDTHAHWPCHLLSLSMWHKTELSSSKKNGLSKMRACIEQRNPYKFCIYLTNHRRVNAAAKCFPKYSAEVASRYKMEEGCEVIEMCSINNKCHSSEICVCGLYIGSWSWLNCLRMFNRKMMAWCFRANNLALRCVFVLGFGFGVQWSVNKDVTWWVCMSVSSDLIKQKSAFGSGEN